MPKGRAWTTEEEQFIRDNSGKMSVVEMTTHIPHSPHAIEQHWHEMKREGRAKGSLRHWKSKLEWCEECSAHRNTIPCPVCKQKELLQTKRMEEAQLYAALPAESKERKRPQCHGSKVSTRPKPPDTKGMDAYTTARLNEIYDLVMQKWHMENLQRQNKTLQKRIERLRKELKEEK